MRFEVVVTEEAVSDLRHIHPFYRAQLLDALETYLSTAPTQESKSRIKRLHLLDSPAYRLRVGEFRIYYDVAESTAMVTVLRILGKEASLVYLSELEKLQ